MTEVRAAGSSNPWINLTMSRTLKEVAHANPATVTARSRIAQRRIFVAEIDSSRYP